MEKVKTAFEKAMEKAAGIGELTPKEKEQLKEQEMLRILLSEFYKGNLDRDALWQKMKGTSLSLLKEAQISVIHSLGLNTSPEGVLCGVRLDY